MYINKVDNVIDKVIDEFSIQVISNTKKITPIISEPNFVKYQKEINSIIVDYIETIPKSKIDDIVKKGDSINSIYNTLKKYTTIYLFLYIGYYFTWKDDIFINNIVEFSKNQSNHALKITNFFNSASNASIIEYFYIIKNMILLFSQSSPKIASLEKVQYGKKTIDLLTQLGTDFIKENFMIDNKNDQAHNIIKTIIVLLIYRVYEKKDFYKLLELSESDDGEYIFIDVVQPSKQYIDFNSIESLLSKDDVINGLAYDIWDYLGSFESDEHQLGIVNDEKILNMINSGLLVPIVDDFLLYHKDTEKYDRAAGDDVKKKDDTKIRYIINKIDTVSEFYSESIRKNSNSLADVKKKFYAPLYDRKAILRNEIEELKVINKFINQGKRNTENNEYFNDLLGYRNYPFINFKDYEKDGFSLACNKTINLVRSVSFATQGEFKQNPRNKLQTRIGSDNMLVNVVGLMIPIPGISYKCLKIEDFKDIKQGKHVNGVDLVVENLKRFIIDGKSSKTPMYWMFDAAVDSIASKTYEKTAKNTSQDTIKNILTDLYDVILESVYHKILDVLDTHDKLTLYQATHISNMIQKKLFRLHGRQDLIDELDNYIYTKKLLTSDETYDENDDMLYGLTGNVFTMSDNPIKNKSPRQVLIIDPLKLDETGEQDIEAVILGICQHNITWDDISKKKREDPKSYMEDVFEYIKKYVAESTGDDYICKSCGSQLNIKKYVADGTFDNDTQRFITYSMPMEIPLEEIQEYEKYKPSIKILDKIVEKIASITNVTYLVGSNTTTKWKRKTVIKNVIDTILHNNANLKHQFKERNEQANKLLGINRNISNLFVFDLDNSIFQFSSKDKDQYKPIKMNNIISYIVMHILLDINNSHVAFLSSDKKFFCDFEFFDKYYKILYDGLKFIKNNNMDTVKVIDSKIFCYALYMISCKLAKHRLWYFDDDTSKTVSKKKIPLVQKSIMHTVVDLINSVLENSFKKNSGYELEIFRTKFYEKLATVFNNEDVYNSLVNQGKTTTMTESNEYIMTQSKTIVSTYDGPRKFDIEHKFIPCRQVKYYLPYRAKLAIEFSGLNAFTNCSDGVFHTWSVKDKTFVCNKCGTKLISIINTSSEIDKKITDKFVFKNLAELATVYCNDGTLHQFIDDEKSGRTKCIKCEQLDNKGYTNEELVNMNKNIRNNQIKNIEHSMKTTNVIMEKEKEENYYIKKVVEHNYSNMKEYNKSKKTQYIYDFINEMEQVIGNDKNILKNSRLNDNIYTIDHDHLGYSLEVPIVITDSDNKIVYKENHSHFKTDVIYYTNYKSGKVDVYYDAITKVLIGYKEDSKEYTNYTKTDKKLKIDYSIHNKIILLGYDSQYIDILDNYENIVEKFKCLDKTDENKQKMYKLIVTDIIMLRHHNIKKSIRDFQRLFSRIINNYAPPKKGYTKNTDSKDAVIDEESFFSSKPNNIVSKYVKKLKNMEIANKSNKGRILKHWKAIVRGTLPGSLKEIYFNYSDTLINANTVSEYDEMGNTLLFYMVSEMKKLLEYNPNKFTKISIVTFLIDFINVSFDMFNIERLMNNKDIKRFTYVLKSNEYLRDFEDRNDAPVNKGIYEEYSDEDDEVNEETLEEIEDATEEQDALDIDEGFESDSAFEGELNWNTVEREFDYSAAFN